MVLFEDLPVGDAAWLTITTATTVGYGDISATTVAGRWSTVLLMYVGGIFILAQLAGLIFEGVQSKLEKQRLGQVNLNVVDHVVIFGYREKFLHRVIQEIRNSSSDLRKEEIVIVSPTMQELPEDFVRQAVFHVSGALYDDEILDRANLIRAKRIAILPEADGDKDINYANLELVARLGEQAPEVPIVYAANTSGEMALAEELGAEDAIIFDPNYPDIFARAIISLGAEDILTDIVDRDGVEIVIVHKHLKATVKQVMEATAEWATLLGVRIGIGEYKIYPPGDLTLTDHRLVFLADVSSYGSDEAAHEAIVKALQPLIVDGEPEEFIEPKKIGLIGSEQRLSSSFLKQLEGELEDQTITHLTGELIGSSAPDNFKNLSEYDAVVLLASDPTDPHTDAATYLGIRQLRNSYNYEGRIIAEAVLPQSKERFNKAGANDVLRPVIQNVEILGRCITTGAEGNVALQVAEAADKDSFEVSGRGELQLAVLIETMRREGFEIAVSRPRVVMREEGGQTLEPIEEVTIDVDEEHQGVVVDKLTQRRAELVEMRPSGAGRTRVVFHAPTRGLIGYQSELLTDTRGTAVMNRLFHAYEPHRGPIGGRTNGVLIANEAGVATPYALFNLEDRGPMVIDPGAKVYAGMIIGIHNRPNDLEVNVLRAKKLTNIRAAGKDDAVKLTPPVKMTLERALSWIEDDELVEVTPASIRLRKRYLDTHERKRFEKARAAA